MPLFMAFAALGLLIGAGFFSPAAVLAQGQAPTPQPAAPGGQESGERPATVYYLVDKDGQLQPVLGFTLEDFDRLLKLEAGQAAANERPVYRVQRLALQGQTAGERADLTLELLLFVEGDDWVRVPLRLGSAILRSGVEYAGPGEQFLVFDETEQQFVAWLRGGGDEPHKLTLQVSLPLAALGGAQQLRMQLPRAQTSELVLSTPESGVQPTVSSGAVVESVESSDDQTTFRILGLVGDCAVSWRPAAEPTDERPQAIEAYSLILVALDGRTVECDATLTVRSFGQPLTEFEVLLPLGASLLPTQPPAGVTLAAQNAADESRVLLRATLRSPTLEPVVLRLQTEQFLPPGAAFDLEGWEVPTAVRQSGYFALQTAEEWRAVASKPSGVLAVDSLPTELQRPGVVAGYEYFQQPWGLTLSVEPRQSSVQAEAVGLAVVERQRISLTVQLACRVAGQPLRELPLSLNGWTLEQVGPANLFDTAELELPATGEVVLPLADSASGELELKLELRQARLADAAEVDFELPELPAGFAVSSTLVVLADEQVGLLPAWDRCQGLARRNAPVDMELPPHEQAPWHLRAEPGARFVAQALALTQTVSVEMHARVLAAQGQATVEEELEFFIAHGALEQLQLLAPAELRDPGAVEVFVAGARRPVTLLEATTPQTHLLLVPLTAASRGRLSVRIRYQAPWEEVPPGTSGQRFVPLLTPAASDSARWELELLAEQGLQLRLNDERWTALSTDRSQTPRYGAATALEGVHCVLDRAADGTAEDLIVQRAWLQTWLSANVQQDRCVYYVSGPAAELVVEIFQAELLQALVDGQSVACGRDAAGFTRVPLSAAAGTSNCVELWLRRQTAGLSSFTSQELQLPRLVHRQPAASYWQLLVPNDWCLWSNPAGLTAESRWQWRTLGWRRVPVFDQAALEHWAGATRQPSPPAAARIYLFNAPGQPPAASVRMIRRPLLVLLCSGFVLALGLVALQYPVVRRSSALLAFSVLLVGAALAASDWALLLAQAGLLGGLCAALAWFLHASNQRRGRPAMPATLRTGSSLIVPSGSTQIPPLAGAEPGSATPATSDLPVALSDSNA